MTPLLTVLALVGPPGGPSFDCAKATSPVERLVCSDPALGAADRDLAAAYARVSRKSRDGAGLRDDQRAWLARRDACGDRSCLADSYRRRAAELARLLAFYAADATVVVTCDAGTLAVDGRSLARPPVEVPLRDGEIPLEVARAPLGSRRFVLTEGDRHADCRHADGRTVRLKLADVSGSGFGECGAVASVDMSVWLDQAPVVSRMEVADRCRRQVLHTLILDATGLRTCSAGLTGDEPPSLSAPACSFKAASELRRDVDRVEYALSPAPEEGKILTAYAADAALCQSMVVPREDELGHAAWDVTLPPASRTPSFAKTEDLTYRSGGQEYPGSTRLGRFDADNDGAPDGVYWLYGEHRGFWGDKYFVLPRGPAIEDGELDDERLRERSRRVFPDSWAASGESEEAYTLKHYRRPAGPASLAFDRLILKPFSLGGVTYFLADTWRDTTAERLQVVLRPRPSGPVDEVCIFAYVERHM